MRIFGLASSPLVWAFTGCVPSSLVAVASRVSPSIPIMCMLIILLLTAIRVLRATFIVSGTACVWLSSSGRAGGMTTMRGRGVGAGITEGAGNCFAFGDGGAFAGGGGVSCASAIAPLVIAIASVNVVSVLLNIVVNRR